MTKPQYNQGDLLRFDVGADKLLQLAVVISIFSDKGQRFYEMRWATSGGAGDRFTGNIKYLDDSTVWSLVVRGQ